MSLEFDYCLLKNISGAAKGLISLSILLYKDYIPKLDNFN